MKSVDWIAAIGYIASGGGAIVVTALSTAFPNQSEKIIAYGAIIVFIASILVRLYNNKTGQAATSVIANAPAISPTTGAEVGTIDHTP